VTFAVLGEASSATSGGHPTRRRLLNALLTLGEAIATTFSAEVPVTRQTVAKHLAVLDRAGLVDGRRDGREVLYAVRPDRLDEVSRAMARVAAGWDQRLAAIKRLAESHSQAVANRQSHRTRN
jgi:ArsR family transcriptional regulator, cadmium/lead-responsive transcriptional repressor